jgi:hypothetical protein
MEALVRVEDIGRLDDGTRAPSPGVTPQAGPAGPLGRTVIVLPTFYLHLSPPSERPIREMFASSYPLLNVFWTMLWFFLFVIWIWILISIFIDIFRSHDIGGFAKALWILFIIFLPLLGVLVYLIARGGKMQERAVQQAAQSQAQFDDYVRQTAGASSTASQLSDLAKLKESGAITDEDYEKAKAKILS